MKDEKWDSLNAANHSEINEKKRSNGKRNAEDTAIPTKRFRKSANAIKLDSNENGETLNVSTENQFKCKICEKTVKWKISLLAHEKTHLEDEEERKPFKCGECGVRYSTRTCLSDHMILHLKNDDPRKKELQCEICGKQVTTKRSLEYHKKLHLDDDKEMRPLECDDCGMRFTHPSALRSHKQTHMGDDDPRKMRKACDICGKIVRDSNMKTHLQTHMDGKDANHITRPFKCDICGVQFTRISALEVHKRTHSDDESERNPHQCEQCGVRFTRPGSLRRHIHLQHGSAKESKDIKCDICDKSFTRSDTLSQHMRSHSGDVAVQLPFECAECGKKFPYRHSLTSHMGSHSDERQYKCGICEMTFKFPSNLKSHERKMHHSDVRTMPIPIASMQSSIFSSEWPTLDQPFGATNMSPRQENLGRQPHCPMTMTNPCPYGTFRSQYCPVPAVPIHNPGFHGYHEKAMQRPCFPPPLPPRSHDAPSLNYIARAFKENPRAIMRPCTPMESAAYIAAYSYRFRNDRKYEVEDDLPPTRDLLRKVADWIVTSNFDVREGLQMTM